jgi:branched-chain amino acid transport system permease protein
MATPAILTGGDLPPLAVPTAGDRRPSLRRRRRRRLVTSWSRELALLETNGKRVAAVVLLVLAVLLPFHVGDDIVRIGVLSLVAVVGAIAMTLVSGVAGQLSLGHAAFIGLGAYSGAWVTTNQGWSFWWAFPVAAATSGLLGAVLAPVALRLRGLYLAVVTIGLIYGMQHLFRVAESFTGGVNGARVDPPTLFGLDFVRGGEKWGITFGRGVPYYYLCLFAALVAVVVAKNLLRSSVGRSFAAVRDQDIAAGVVGVNPFKVKTQAFVVSSAMAGVAGTLLAGFLRFVNFEQWNLALSTQYLAMIVIGGIGVVSGAVLGALFVTALPEVIDRSSGVLGFLSSDGATGLTPERLSAVVYGLLLAFVMVAEPQGLFGLWRRLRTYFTNWPFRSVK